MTIYLLRHGEAEQNAPSDAERALTERGLADLARVGRRFREFEPRIDLCLVSPYLRARQSATAFLEALGQQPRLSIAPWLRPDESPRQALKLLDTLMARDLLLVAHNPLLSALGNLLLEGGTRGPLALGTAELLWIDCEFREPGQGQLRQHLRPNDA